MFVLRKFCFFNGAFLNNLYLERWQEIHLLEKIMLLQECITFLINIQPQVQFVELKCMFLKRLINLTIKQNVAKYVHGVNTVCCF